MRRRFRWMSYEWTPGSTWKTCVSPANLENSAVSVEPSDCLVPLTPLTRQSSFGRDKTKVNHLAKEKGRRTKVGLTCSVEDGSEKGSAVCLSSCAMISSKWLNSAHMAISSLCIHKKTCTHHFHHGPKSWRGETSVAPSPRYGPTAR